MRRFCTWTSRGRPFALTIRGTRECRFQQSTQRLLTAAECAIDDVMSSNYRILFVCMGNICRSPSAEGVFRHVLSTHAPDLRIEIDSAGTHDYHVGSPPDRRSIEAARRRGIDLSGLRARMVCAEDFERYDLILAMDEDNLRELRRRAPTTRHERIRLLMEFAPNASSRYVPDPYYGGAQGFEEVLDLLEEAAQGLVAELRNRHR
jgi:Protein-tyrosine-phosphatase